MKKKRRAGNTTITRVTDRWNPKKVWLLKHYADGHYMLNQEIAGRRFYGSYQRSSRGKIGKIFAPAE